jgi:NAD(P)-dependent dehydrogenase (short-subunit alcohol dehydrogenase family)
MVSPSAPTPESGADICVARAVYGRRIGVDLGLAGKRAVVTGASKGIGLAVARALAVEGVHIIAGSRTSSTELKELVNRGEATDIEVDLISETGPSRLVETALEGGPVDFLINNAGAVTPRTNGSGSVTDEQWSYSINLTLMAAVRATRAVLPHMIERGRGAIVNTASVNASLPDPLVIDYSAAKAALVNFSKALSKEVGPYGIRVNTVSPGPVATDLWVGKGGVASTLSASLGGIPSDYEQQAVAGTATQRFTTPQEVADLIVFLASDRSGNITGADYIIDGGLTQSI